MRLKQIAIAFLALLAAASVHAGNGEGRVGQVLVGRMGNQVYIELQASQFANWPCGTTHSAGFRYAFLLTWPGAKEMLATVLAAQASGQNLIVVGSGSCSVDSALEDVAYVVLKP